jgi:putative transcriptional regulator
MSIIVLIGFFADFGRNPFGGAGLRKYILPAVSYVKRNTLLLMDYRNLSNDAILAELGDRLRQLRLNADISQEALAEATGLSRKTVQNAESGENCSMDTLVRMLRGLNALDQLENFMPAPGPSPMQMAKLHGKIRRRASTHGDAASSGSKGPHNKGGSKKDDWEW